MAVIRTDEVWHGRFGSEDEKAVRNYVRAFRVYTDSMLTGPAEVGSDPSLPRRFDTYQDGSGYTDSTALAQSIRVTQTDDPFSWDVVVEYSNRCDQPELGTTDPLARPCEIEIDFEQFTRIAETDQSGTAILNSAFERFDPPPEMDDSRPIITFTRNEAAIDYDILVTYQDAVNSKTWLGFAPKTAKLRIKATRHYENNIYYWQVTYRFSIRADDWRLKLLDQGYFALDNSGNRQMITDKFGVALTTPALLDGSGKQLAYSNVGNKFNSVYLNWDIYQQADFNLLNLV